MGFHRHRFKLTGYVEVLILREGCQLKKRHEGTGICIAVVSPHDSSEKDVPNHALALRLLSLMYATVNQLIAFRRIKILNGWFAHTPWGTFQYQLKNNPKKLSLSTDICKFLSSLVR